MSPPPRFAARLVWAAGVALAAALADGPASLAFAGAAGLAGWVLSRRLGRLARVLPGLVGLALFAWIVNLVATPGAPVWPQAPWSPSHQGLVVGAQTAARLAITALALGWLTATTNAGEAMDAVTAAAGRVFGRRADAAGVAVLAALRFGPLLLAEAARVRRAIALRGGRAPGLQELPALAVPIVLSGVRRADRLAWTLEARHFGVARRTPPARAPWRRRDVGTVLAAVLAVAAAWRMP